MTSSDYRRIAREKLSGHWGISVGTALIAGLLGGAVSSSGDLSFLFNEELLAFMPNALLALFATIGAISGLLSLAQFIIGGTVQIGYTHYLLKQQDGGELKLQDLFSQFHRFGAGFLQAFLRSLYILLWSLLLVVPGIVKGFSYAMTPFIMADHPEMSANEAITASRELMDGHKWDLFLLNLSFIGWNLLSLLTLGILSLWIIPYQNAAHAAFYRDISST